MFSDLYLMYATGPVTCGFCMCWIFNNVNVIVSILYDCSSEYSHAGFSGVIGNSDVVSLVYFKDMTGDL